MSHNPKKIVPNCSTGALTFQPSSTSDVPMISRSSFHVPECGLYSLSDLHVFTFAKFHGKTYVVSTFVYIDQ